LIIDWIFKNNTIIIIIIIINDWFPIEV